MHVTPKHGPETTFEVTGPYIRSVKTHKQGEVWDTLPNLSGWVGQTMWGWSVLRLTVPLLSHLSPQQTCEYNTRVGREERNYPTSTPPNIFWLTSFLSVRKSNGKRRLATHTSVRLVRPNPRVRSGPSVSLLLLLLLLLPRIGSPPPTQVPHTRPYSKIPLITRNSWWRMWPPSKSTNLTLLTYLPIPYLHN